MATLTDAQIADFRQVIADQMDIAVDRVRPEATFDELGFDSLDLIEVVMEIEEHYHIEIDESQLASTLTIAGAESALAELLSRRG